MHQGSLEMSARLRLLTMVSVLALLFAVPAFAQTEDEEVVNGPVKSASAASAVYIVQMNEPPVIAYEGGIAGLKPTAPGKGKKLDPNDPDVVRYASHLDARHSAVASKVNARKVYDYRYAFNGFAARLTASEAGRLKFEPGVVSVEKTVEVTMDTATTPAFLGLNDPVNGVWTRLGVKGEDVIIGIVDSGVWPESRSFSDRTGSGPNGQEGKLDYHQIPGWHGRCVPGEAFNASHCNQKLIGAQYFCESRGCDNVLPHEFLSPRDFNGHGTHTASTAGGNEGVEIGGASVLAINGMAPRARISAYKVCWDNGAGSCGANTGDVVAAIDQAVIDGVDVINYSISGTLTNYLDSVEVAYLFAADAGVFVATSAGNSGPTASTVAHISPWLSSVAAGTHARSGTATVTRADSTTHNGLSLTVGVGPAPVVLATASGLPGADPNLVRQCFSADAAGNAVLDPAKVSGRIVVCERGGAAPANARVDKSLAVQNAGGVGVIIYNVAAGATLNADLHSISAVHVDNVAGAAIVSYVNAAGPLAGATLSRAVPNNSIPAPDVAGFSSRGPSRAGLGDILKPDFMAPGVDILAAVAPPGNGGSTIASFQGTSMSSPHVAGLGALLTQAHRDWSPAAMRSALATTADAVSRPGLALPFNVGSGHVRPNLAVNPGLVYDATFDDYLKFLKGQGLILNPVPAIDASDLNQPSLAVGDLPGRQTLTRRVTNVGGSAATYTAAVVPPPGFTATVTPSSFTIPNSGSQTFQVTLTRTAAALNTYVFGSLTWSDGSHSVRSPIVVRPVAIAAAAEIKGTGASGSSSFPIKTGYDGALAYTPRGLVAATPFSATVTDDPTNNFVTATPTANQGITTHDIVVPSGTTVLRVSMFDADTDGEDDIDLYLYRVNTNGTLTLVALSAGGTSAEQVQLSSLTGTITAATYRLFVHGWQTDGPDANYTLYAWTLGTANAGNMTASGPAPAVIGAAGTVNVSWSGLTAGSKYLGRVDYQQGATIHATTVVRIDP